MQDSRPGQNRRESGLTSNRAALILGLVIVFLSLSVIIGVSSAELFLSCLVGLTFLISLVLLFMAGESGRAPYRERFHMWLRWLALSLLAFCILLNILDLSMHFPDLEKSFYPWTIVDGVFGGKASTITGYAARRAVIELPWLILSVMALPRNAVVGCVFAGVAVLAAFSNVVVLAHP